MANRAYGPFCSTSSTLPSASRPLHLGCGTGYYTAVAAELVGQMGKITAIEIDPGLAEKARAALMPWPQIRAVQRSIYDTHSEDGADAAKGDAMASVCDIVNAIEAQDVGGERAQACKDAGIASDAAGVFCEATVADVVRAVLDAPVVADGLGALSGRQHDVTDEQCGFAG